MAEKQPTLGQKLVGIAFNPEGNPEVAKLKQQYADLIDAVNYIREHCTDSEVHRMASIAITEAQTSQMWAVKAVTWRG